MIRPHFGNNDVKRVSSIDEVRDDLGETLSHLDRLGRAYENKKIYPAELKQVLLGFWHESLQKIKKHFSPSYSIITVFEGLDPRNIEDERIIGSHILKSLRNKLKQLRNDVPYYEEFVPEEKPNLYQQAIDLFHPKVKEISGRKFADGHYADSVESAFKEVVYRVKIYVKEKTGTELDGSKLMYHAMGCNDPIIDFGDSEIDQTKNSLREGYRNLFAGSVQAIRNPKAHQNLDIDENLAFHFLSLASLQMTKLDEAGVP